MAELLDEIRAVETLRRQLEAVSNRQLAEADQRAIAHEHACTSTAELLIQLLLVSTAEAKLMAGAHPRRPARMDPTAWLDPTRKPVRNTAHLPDFTFDDR